MTQPLCSFLIPSRGRPDGLRRAIQSLHESATSDRWEALVRLDDCDPLKDDAIAHVKESPNARYIVGERLFGYRSMGRFIQDLCDIAQGKWCSMLDDDCALKGDWFHELQVVPCGRDYCFTQFYELGQTAHHEQKWVQPYNYQVGWFVPTNIWKQFGTPHLEQSAGPLDCWFVSLAVRHVFAIHRLEGVSYCHFRDSCKEMEVHRKLTHPYYSTHNPEEGYAP